MNCFSRYKSILFAMLVSTMVLPANASTSDADKEEALAYSLGTHAYTFGFPWVYLSQLRYM